MAFEIDPEIIAAVTNGTLGAEIEKSQANRREGINYEHALYEVREICAGDIQRYCDIWANAYPLNEHTYEMDRSLVSIIEELPEDKQLAAVAIATDFYKRLYTNGRISVSELASIPSSDVFKSDEAKPDANSIRDFAKAELLKNADALFSNPQPDAPFDIKAFQTANPNWMRDIRPMQIAKAEHYRNQASGKRREILEGLSSLLNGFDGIDNVLAIKAYEYFEVSYNLGDNNESNFQHYTSQAFGMMDEATQEIYGLRAIATLAKQRQTLDNYRDYERYIGTINQFTQRRLPPKVVDAAREEMISAADAEFALNGMFTPLQRNAGNLLKDLPPAKRSHWGKKLKATLDANVAGGKIQKDDEARFIDMIAQSLGNDEGNAALAQSVSALLDENDRPSARYLSQAAKSLATLGNPELQVYKDFEAKLRTALHNDTIGFNRFIEVARMATEKFESRDMFDAYKRLIEFVLTIEPAEIKRDEAGKIIPNDKYKENIQKTLLGLAMDTYRLAQKIDKKLEKSSASKKKHWATTGRDWALRVITNTLEGMGNIVNEDGNLRGRLYQLFSTNAAPSVKSNHFTVWRGINNKGTPAFVFYSTAEGDGAPNHIVNIFNMRGTITEVTAEVTKKYPANHQRRVIFDKFVRDCGLGLSPT